MPGFCNCFDLPGNATQAGNDNYYLDCTDVAFGVEMYARHMEMDVRH